MACASGTGIAGQLKQSPSAPESRTTVNVATLRVCPPYASHATGEPSTVAIDRERRRRRSLSVVVGHAICPVSLGVSFMSVTVIVTVATIAAFDGLQLL